MQKKEFRLPLGDKELIFNVGLLAQQCNASVWARSGDTSVLATCAISRDANESIDYMPLMINYIEKYYAAGVIGGVRYRRREGRPSDEQILIGRAIDRGLRPMFPKHMRHEVQIMVNVLSYDFETPSDMVAANAASFVAAISSCPIYSALGTVRVGMIEGEFVLNPTEEEIIKSDLNLIVTSTTEKVVMIESQSNEVPEEKMYEAIMFGKKWGQTIAKFIDGVQKEIGVQKVEIKEPEIDAEISKQLESDLSKEIEEIMFANISKQERFGKIANLVKESEAKIKEQTEDEEKVGQVKNIIDKIVKQQVRHHILESGKRINNRAPDQIRDLNCQVDLIPRAHGSGLFERGETQGLTITTLGGPGDVLLLEGMLGESKKRYFHHYNFPPFSVGEVSRRLFTGNREIGHGSLAEKALLAVLPTKEEFPYTIRTVTEILQSNGSSSMAAVCGCTLSLMAAGVPIKEPVSGIAMGMMSDEEKGTHKILTDLQDEEDFGGDMDFKIAGTKNGITAIQVDIKLKGLSDEVILETLNQSKIGRMKIMEAMLAVLPGPRESLNEYAPRLMTIKIDPEQIRAVIGKGGEVINGIIDETGVAIDIEDDGTVIITSKSAEGADKAAAIINKITEKPEIGKIYTGKVIKIMDFGAFVEILPRKEGLVHVSCISDQHVKDVKDVLKEGQEVTVKLLDIDNLGRLRLSMKDAVDANAAPAAKKPEAAKSEEAKPEAAKPEEIKPEAT